MAMQAQEMTFREGLTKGLRPSDDNTRNTQLFAEFQDGRATQYGFVPYESIANTNLNAWLATKSITPGWFTDGAWPQMYRGKQGTLLMTTSAVYVMNESSWNGTLVVFRDLDDPLYAGPETPFTITPNGGRWNVADLGEVIFLFNDSNILWVYPGAAYSFGQHQIVASAGCEHQGRMLMGGFSESANKFWTAKWDEIAALVNTKYPLVPSVRERDIMYSSFLGFDVRCLFDPLYAVYGPLLGPERLRNAQLTHNPASTPLDTYRWYLTGCGWSTPLKAIVFNGRPQYMHQPVAIEPGTYIVGFEIGMYNAGMVRAILADTPGAVAGEWRSANGYYWEEITVVNGGTGFQIETPDDIGALGLTVDNVTCRRVNGTGHGFTKPFIVDFAQRGDRGNVAIPWQGAPVVLKPLGESVVAYCENGVSLLTPFVEPTPGYGPRRLIENGIHGRSAVDGDDYTHLFVDLAGYLWRISQGGKVERLDYHHLFVPLTDIVVTFNPVEQEAWISGEKLGSPVGYYFSLPTGGMSEVYESVTGGVVINGGMLGTRATRTTDWLAVTDTFDMDFRGVKTITNIEIGMTQGTGGTVRVLFKNDRMDGWSHSAAHAVRTTEQTGLSTLRMCVTGVEFRIEILFDTTDVEIDYMKVYWRTEGKHNARSVLGGWS